MFPFPTWIQQGKGAGGAGHPYKQWKENKTNQPGN
jgi:hypothetical protein